MSKRARAHVGKLLTNFIGESAHLRVVEIDGQAQAFAAALPLDFVFLAIDIASVLRTDFKLQAHLIRQAIIATGKGIARLQGKQIVVTHFRSSQQVERRDFAQQRHS